MNSILSLWALLCLISFCECMDRHRNKLCYAAMTCIHTGNEKCGLDGKGNYRRFYDSCDMLELNCLKKKDYVKIDKRNCINLPPIDDKQDTKGTENNNVHDVGNDNVSNGNGHDNKDGIEGSLTIHENGDLEGEIVINEDNKVSGLSPNNKNDMADGVESNHENAGIEGEIKMDEKGSIEGEIKIDDDIVDMGQQASSNIDNPAIEDQQKINQDEPEIVGTIHLDDDEIENISGNNDDAAIEDNPTVADKSDQGIKNVKAKVEFDKEGNMEGEVEFEDEEDAKNQETEVVEPEATMKKYKQ